MKKDNRDEIKCSAHSKYRSCTTSLRSKIQAERILWEATKIYRRDIEKILQQNGRVIIEAEACLDHIHMLVNMSLYISIAQFMGYLNGKSSLMIFDRRANLKYKYGSRFFGAEGIACVI